MSGHDAFEEEMGFARRIRDEDAERLLAGPAPEPGQRPDLDEVAAFLGAARVALPAQPDPRVEAPLVRRLAATVRAASDATTAELTQIPAPAWRPRLALAAKLAVAVALLPITLAGLAFAGVKLPEPAVSALEAVGVELPNQSDDAGDGGAARERTASPGSAGAAERADRGRQDGGGASGSQGGSQGNGNGPAGVPPGQGGVPPGQGGTPPGLGGTPPGQGGTPPGQGGAIPGSGSGGQSALRTAK